MSERKPKGEPEFSFQLFPPKITAKGIEAVRPVVWPTGFLLVCIAIVYLLR